MTDDERIANLKTPEECDQMFANVRDKYPDLALRVKRRGFELRAERYGATTIAEREALQAIYAYEDVKSIQSGVKKHASRTWQMVKRHGIIHAVERAVDRPDETSAYKVLADMKMIDLLFEAVVVRHPEQFSSAVVERCRNRMNKFPADHTG